MKRNIAFVVAAVVVTIAPQTAGGEFIQNGTFEAGFKNVGLSHALDGLPDTIPNVGWTRYETFSGGVVENSLINRFVGNGPSAPGESATLFMRGAGDNASGDFTSLYQALNINVPQFATLTLSMDVMVDWHNLVAGGWVAPAFEWPVVVQIAYKDANNNRQWWRFGWFLENPGDSPPGPLADPGQGLIPIYNDLLVPAGAWVPNAFNLLQQLPQAQTIDQILIGGSGWQFEGVVDNVSLQGTWVPEASSAFPLLGLAVTALAWMRRRRSSRP